MEDHRNWTDASFKTYVRPLALPWPYTLRAGEAVTQSVTVVLRGTPPKPSKGVARKAVEVTIGDATGAVLPPLGLGMPPEEIDHARTHIRLLRDAAPRFLQCRFDPRADHGRAQLDGYRAVCEDARRASACSRSSSSAWRTTRASCGGWPAWSSSPVSVSPASPSARSVTSSRCCPAGLARQHLRSTRSIARRAQHSLGSGSAAACSPSSPSSTASARPRSCWTSS